MGVSEKTKPPPKESLKASRCLASAERNRQAAFISAPPNPAPAAFVLRFRPFAYPPTIKTQREKKIKGLKEKRKTKNQPAKITPSKPQKYFTTIK